MTNTLNNICSNNCEFAKKSLMLSYTNKVGDTYSGAEYMWRCMKIDQIITIDCVLHKLGCASYSNIKQNETNEQVETLINEVDQKIKEIEQKMAVEPVSTVPVVVANEITPDIVVEPIVNAPAGNEIVQNPTGDLPIQNLSSTVPVKDKSDVVQQDVEKKKRGRPSATPTNVTPSTPVVETQGTPTVDIVKENAVNTDVK